MLGQRLSRSFFGRVKERGICHTSPRSTKSAPAVERKDQVKISNENTYPRIDSSTGILPTFESSVTDGKLSKPNDLLTVKIDHRQPSVEKIPFPFEDVPGPAFLKLWEKYYKYVPLIGTQLFRSALINGLTEGNVLWNRNITPLRYLFNEYGPVVRINGPLTGVVVLIHRPEHIAKVFEEEGSKPARSGIDVLQHYRLHHRKYRFTGPYNAQGSQGQEWLQMKKTLEVPISEQIVKQFEKLELACDDLILRIRQTRNRQDEVPGNFSTELTRWGIECLWVLMLNKKMGFLESTAYNENSEPTKFIEALNDAHLYMTRCESGFQFWRFFETPFAKKLYSSCDIIDGVIGKYIRMVQSIGRSDLSSSTNKDESIEMSLLENLLDKQNLNPDDVSTLIMDMIVLGVPATISTQAFLLYYLAKNPRIQKALYDEVMTEMKKNSMITKKSFDSMPCLNACVKECLRLRPPLPYISRLLPKSITLHGYEIPKGTYIIMANQISSQREENFEDADKFKPERWLGSGSDQHPKHSYLPFGKGLRSCMGENMAKLQIMLLTAKIIREFRIEYDYGDMNSRFLMLNVPNRPLRFRFVDRD